MPADFPEEKTTSPVSLKRTNGILEAIPSALGMVVITESREKKPVND
jgi:hypothetical protein